MLDDGWYIQEQYGRQGATAHFVLRAEFLPNAPHETALTLLAKPMSVITFNDTTLGVTLFAGLMTNPEFIFLSATIAEYRLSCRDFTYYADSRLVSASYLSKTVKFAITDLVNNSSTGLTADPDMPDGPVVNAVQFDHVALSDALDQLSQLASWQSDYAYWIGYDKVVHWGNEGDAPVSGVTITDQVEAAPTTLVAHIDKGQPPTYSWDGATLRNKCTVRGASKTRTQTDNWGGDGTTTAWPLSFDLDQSGTIVLTVAGTEQTIEVSSDPTASTKQFALYQAPNGQWFVMKATASVPTTGQAIVISYRASIPVTASYTNSASTVQYAGPNGGIYEIFLADNTLLTSQVAYSRARAEVQQFGLVQERFTFSIAENWPGHIRSGQAFLADMDFIPDSRNNWFVGVIGYFIVVQCTITGRAAGRRQYQIQAVRFDASA